MSPFQPHDADHKSGSQSGEWKLLPLLLIPLACCALPLIIASLATVTALAWSIGLSGAAAVAAVAAVAVIVRRRSRCSTDDGCQPTGAQRPRHRAR